MWIVTTVALLIAIIAMSVGRDTPSAIIRSTPGAGQPGSALKSTQDGGPGGGLAVEPDPEPDEQGAIQGSTPAKRHQDFVSLELPVDPAMRCELTEATRQTPPRSDVDGATRPHFSDPTVSNSGYSLHTGFPSDPSLGPDASDTGELGLPPEASDPGIAGSAPEATGSVVLELAPESGEHPFEIGTPESSDRGLPGPAPEASDPGTMGPAPEASDPPN